MITDKAKESMAEDQQDPNMKDFYFDVLPDDAY